MSGIKRTEEMDLEEIRKGFEKFDVRNEGKIDPLELIEAMDAMNLKDKNPFIYEVIESLCDEKEFQKKGGVTLEELVNYAYSKVSDCESTNGLRQIFDAISDRNTDTVGMQTFYQLAKEYGDKLSENEIRFLLEKTQMMGEELDFDQFHAIMQGANNNNNIHNNINNDKYIINKTEKNIYRKRPTGSSGSSRVVIKKTTTSSKNYDEEEKERQQEPNIKIGDIPSDEFRDQSQKYIEITKNEEVIDDEVNYEPEEKNNLPEETYSYRKVRIEENVPKYGEVAEERISFEPEPEINENLNIELIQEKENPEGSRYKSKKQTKVTELPDGGKEIEVIERTEQIVEEERPSSRGSRYRYNKKYREEEGKEKENNFEQEIKSSYKIRRPRGSEQNSSNNEEERSKEYSDAIEEELKSDIVIPKRYHRRYRETKVTTNEN